MKLRSFAAALAAPILVLGMVAPAFAQSASQIVLASSANPSAMNTNVTFTVTINPSTSTGLVTFNDGSTTIGSANINNGAATFSTSSLSVGTHSISASYGGDSNELPSASNTLSEVITSLAGGQSTSTSLSSSANPATLGSTVTFTAAINPSYATGYVTFNDGSTTLGSANVSNGIAAINITSLAGGTHTITAVYGGDSTYSASTSNTLSQTISSTTGTQATSTTLSSSANPSLAGNNVTFTASLNTSSANGTVTFYDGNYVMGSVSVSGGIATYTTSSLSSGSHSIVAIYNGNGIYSGSTSSTLVQTVNNGTQPVNTTSCSSAASTQLSAMSSALDAFAATGKSAWQTRTNAIVAAAALSDATQMKTALRNAQTTFNQAIAQAQQQLTTAQRNAENAIVQSCQQPNRTANTYGYSHSRMPNAVVSRLVNSVRRARLMNRR